MKRERISWLVGSFHYCSFLFFFFHVIDILEILNSFFCKLVMICCTAAMCDFRRGTLHSILLLPFPTAYGTGKPMYLAICRLHNVNVFGAGGIQIWCCRKVLTKFKILRRLFWWDNSSSKRSYTFRVNIINCVLAPTSLGKHKVFTTTYISRKGGGRVRISLVILNSDILLRNLG